MPALRADALERWLEAERDQLALWLPVGLGAGIAAWFGLPDRSAWLAFLALAIGTGLAALAVAPAGRVGRAVAWLALAAAVGLGLAWARAMHVAAPILDRPQVTELAGTVLRADRLPARAIVRLLIAPAQPTSLPPRVRVSIDETAAPPALVAGDSIRLKVRLAPPAAPAVPGAYDFARVAWFQRIGAVGKALGPVVVTGRTGGRRSFWAWLDARRDALTAHIEARLAGSVGGIAAAFVTGDTGAIAPSDADAMRNSGLAHLLSISGLHIAAVIAAAMWLCHRLLALSRHMALRWPLTLISAAVGAAAGLAYTLLAGAEVPTVRSCVAALLVLAGLALGREAMTLRLVATGALIVMLLWPEAVPGPSFQLSFAAVTAIIAAHSHPRVQAFSHRRDEPLPWRMLRGLAVLLATGLLVEAALAPIGIYHFHRTGLYGAFANIVAIPLTTFVVMPAEAAALLLDVVGWGTPAWWVAGHAIGALLWIARSVAALPGAVTPLPSMPLGAFLLMVAGGLWIALWRSRARRLGVLPLAAGAVWALLTPSPDLLVTDDGRHVAIVAGDGSLRLLRPGAKDYVRDTLGWGAGITADALDLDTMPGAQCSDDSCVATVRRGGRIWRLMATRSPYRIDLGQIAAACGWADIVVSDRRLPRTCRPRWLKLDRPFLADNGGLAIVLASATVRAVKNGDDHPWRRTACRDAAQPNGRSIDTGGIEKRCGPSAVMWKQSSSRTPKRPGT